MTGRTQGRFPRLEDGTRVFVTDGDNAGRTGVITETVYTDEMEAFKARSGDPAVANFAEVDYYVIRTRDAFSDRLEVKPDEIVVATGGNHGRHTPEALLQEYAKEEQRAIDIQHRGLTEEQAHPGSKEDLGEANADVVARRFRGEPSGATAPGETAGGEESGGDTRTNEELKDELRTRDLPVSGNRKELLQRLRDDDEEKGRH